MNPLELNDTFVAIKRRTNADKRNAVKLVLLHPYGRDLSDRQIAKHVGVDHVTVGRVRRELNRSGEISQIESTSIENETPLAQTASGNCVHANKISFDREMELKITVEIRQSERLPSKIEMIWRNPSDGISKPSGLELSVGIRQMD